MAEPVSGGMKGEGKNRHDFDPDGLGRVLRVSAARRGVLTGRSPGDGRDQRVDCSRRPCGGQPGAGQPSLWIVWRRGKRPWVASGRERQGAQSSQGATELVLPGPALGKMQGGAARLSGEAAGEGRRSVVGGS